MAIYRIGRGSDNDIALEDPSVSRHHAELEPLSDGRYRLRDLESSYGTEVDDGRGWAPVEETTVSGAAKIRFGNLETNIGSLLALVSLVHTEARAVSPKRIVRRKTDSDSMTHFARSPDELSHRAIWMIGLAGGGVLVLLVTLGALIVLG